MNSFFYKKWRVRFHKKGWPYSGNYYPYALTAKGIENYFGTKIAAISYIDKFLGWHK